MSRFHFAWGVLAAFLGATAASGAGLQESNNLSPDAPSARSLLQTLPMDEARRLAVQHAIAVRDYGTAENLLAEGAKANPQSQPFLLALANVMFLDGKQLNAAVVLKKAESLGPLDERSRFLLALSYLAINRKRLAVPELETLARQNPTNAVYPYWLSRLAYRATDLNRALCQAETAVRLNPAFMKAYDQLGLCYAGLNRIDEAISAFRHAIRLGEQQRLKSPWPAMNLGTVLLRAGRLDEAESALRQSLQTDPRFPVAHLRLAKVFERKALLDLAVAELKEALRSDPTYPDPHYALARIYRQQGDSKAAQQESMAFVELRKADERRGVVRPD